MKKRKLVFKTLDNVQLHFFLIFSLMMAPLNIAATPDLLNNFDFWAFLLLAILNFLIIGGFVLSKIIFWEKYVIDETYITKYVKKQPVFKIKIEDVEKIFIRKEKPYAFFVSLFYLVLEGPLDEDMLTNTSIAFKRCEIIKKPKYGRFYSIKPDGYNELFEWCDCYSLGKAKKLCKKLGITPTYVK